MKARALILGVVGLGALAFAGQQTYAADRRDVREVAPVRYEAPAQHRDADDHRDFDNRQDFDHGRVIVDRDDHRPLVWSHARDDYGVCR